jgi:hypothetical protein
MERNSKDIPRKFELIGLSDDRPSISQGLVQIPGGTKQCRRGEADETQRVCFIRNRSEITVPPLCELLLEGTQEVVTLGNQIVEPEPLPISSLAVARAQTQEDKKILLADRWYRHASKSQGLVP